MFLFIDTCFLNHLFELYDHGIIDLRPILLRYRIAITESVKFELIHFQLDEFLDLKEYIIFSTSEFEREKLIDFDNKTQIKKKMNPFLSFDVADLSLLVIGKKTNGILLTDDRPLRLEARFQNIPSMGLPEFILKNIQEGLIKKNLGMKCFRYWQKVGRYKKRTLKNFKEKLVQIN